MLLGKSKKVRGGGVELNGTLVCTDDVHVLCKKNTEILLIKLIMKLVITLICKINAERNVGPQVVILNMISCSFSSNV
jgi:hypothetical protein